MGKRIRKFMVWYLLVHEGGAFRFRGKDGTVWVCGISVKQGKRVEKLSASGYGWQQSGNTAGAACQKDGWMEKYLSWLFPDKTAGEKTVTEAIEGVKEDVCRNLCRYPGMYTPDEWEEVFGEVCSGCPLDRL